MAEHYELPAKPKILDIGFGKVCLLYDFFKVMPDVEIYEIETFTYTIANSKGEIRDRLQVESFTCLPLPDDHFDLLISITTLHNLLAYALCPALKVMERMGKLDKYLYKVSYRKEQEKAKFQCWQVTRETFNTTKEWLLSFEQTVYNGNYSFIYFK